MTEYKDNEKHSSSENNVGPIVFKYCWKPSGITKNEFDAVPFIKHELNQCENNVFSNKNDELTWNDNITIDEVDIKTELSVTLDSEESDSSDWGFNVLAKELQRLVDTQFSISSADDCNGDSPASKPINAEETAVDKRENAVKVNKNKKKTRQKDSVLICSYCPYKSLRKSHFNNHVRSHKETIRQVLMCNHCHFTTLGKNILRRHISLHFPNLPTPGLLKCHHCNFSANKKSSMGRHMLRHLKTFPISCISCAYKCNTNAQLKIHNKTQHEKKQLIKTKVCEICGKVISGLNNVTAHMLTHKIGPHFFCKLCPYSGRCRKRYRTHVLSHSDGYKAPVRHACAMCDYTSEQLRHVRRHAIVHLRKASGTKGRRRRTKKKEV